MPDFPPQKIYKLKRLFRYQIYKDSHPFYAWFMRLVDGKFGRFLAEKVNIAHYPFNWLMKTLSRFTEKNEHQPQRLM